LDPSIVHVIGKLSKLVLWDNTPNKYEYPTNPLIVVYTRLTTLLNILVHIGVTMNIITREILELIELVNLSPTPAILELVDRSKIQPEGIFDVFII